MKFTHDNPKGTGIRTTVDVTLVDDVTGRTYTAPGVQRHNWSYWRTRKRLWDQAMADRPGAGGRKP